jgi:ATP-dependent DNA helicase RecG
MPNNTLVNNEIVEQHITKNVTKTTPITLSGAALKVVRMIEKNPNITTAQMAEVIGVAKKNLIAFTNNLQRDGIIRHIGPARGGHWEVTI